MAAKRFYLIHGSDEFAIERRIKSICDTFSDPTSAQMNTARLDMAKVDVAQAIDAAFAMPFLSDTRYVILDNAVHPFVGNVGKTTVQHYRTQMLDMLNRLPPTSALIVTYNADIDAGKDKKAENPLAWLSGWSAPDGQSFQIDGYTVPRSEGDKRKWILKAAKEIGLSIHDQAVGFLISFSGEFDTRALGNEIAKLAAYVNYERMATLADVTAVCVSKEVFSIFELTDAIGQQELTAAMKIYRNLSQELDPATEIFPMIVRQYRLLLQVAYVEQVIKEPSQIPVINGLSNSWVADKIRAQARKYSFESLRRIYKALLDLDLAAKRSRIDPGTGIEIFIYESSRGAVFPISPILTPRPVVEHQ